MLASEIHFRNLQSVLKMHISCAAIIDIKYSPFPSEKNTILVVTDVGYVSLFRDAGSHRYHKSQCHMGYKLHNNIVFAIEWISPSSFLSASADKMICEWQLSSDKIHKKATFQKHSSGVKSLSICPENESCFVSGGRDGNILLWDKRCHSSAMVVSKGAGRMPMHPTGKLYKVPLVSILKAHESFENIEQSRKKVKTNSTSGSVDSLNGITSVKWLHNNQLLSCAAAHSTVLMWDIRMTPNMSSACSDSFGYFGSSTKRVGFSSISVSPYEDYFVVSCTDSKLYEYRLLGPRESEKQCSIYNNPSGCSYFTKTDLDPFGSYIIAGSCDKKAFIWQRGLSEPLAELKSSSHHEEMTCVAWNKFDSHCISTACEGGLMSLWTKDFMLSSHLTEGEVQTGEIQIFNNFPKSLKGHRTDSVSKSLYSRKFGKVQTYKNRTENYKVNQISVSPLKSSKTLDPFSTPAKPQPCLGLRNLPDYVKYTPRTSSLSILKTPSTCPVVSSRSNMGLTPSPRKQFLSNFRSAFKTSPYSSPISRRRKKNISPSPRNMKSALAIGSNGTNSVFDFTPLKTNLALANYLSPIPESVKIQSKVATASMQQSNSTSAKENLQVKRKLDQF